MATKITDKIADTVSDVAEDIGYKTSRLGAIAVGKTSAPIIGPAVAEMFAGMMASVWMIIAGAGAGGAAGFGVTPWAIGLVAAFTAVSAAVSQSDHLHRRKLLLNEYREEIGAAVGKAPKDVTEADMHRLAEGDVKAGIIANPALKESLAHSANERNLGIVLSSVASVGAFFLANKLMPDPPGAPTGIIEKFVHEPLRELGHMALGMAAYFAIKEPLHLVSTKVLGLSRETVQERIEGIRKAHAHGRAVTPEQVMEVCLDARPEIAEQIKNAYGKSFEALKAPEREQVQKIFGEQLKVDALAKDVNTGRIKPEEIAFAAYGQASGVKPAEPQRAEKIKVQSNLLSRFWKKLSFSLPPEAQQALAGQAAELKESLPGNVQVTLATSPDGAQRMARIDQHFAAPGMEKNFVAMVGRSQSDSGVGHVERLVQASSQEITSRFP